MLSGKPSGALRPVDGVHLPTNADLLVPHATDVSTIQIASAAIRAIRSMFSSVDLASEVVDAFPLANRRVLSPGRRDCTVRVRGGPVRSFGARAPCRDHVPSLFAAGGGAGSGGDGEFRCSSGSCGTNRGAALPAEFHALVQICPAAANAYRLRPAQRLLRSSMNGG